MGMFDYVVVLDAVLECAEGHRLNGFQTKSFDDPSMATYLVKGPHVHLVSHAGLTNFDADEDHWRLEDTAAVYSRHHAVSPVLPPNEVVFYTTCDACEPVLVRSDYATVRGDLVDERRLWVEFRAAFNAGASRRIDRTSGTRSDLIAELREDGIRVIRDDEPLAIAHREVRARQAAARSGTSRRVRRG